MKKLYLLAALLLAGLGASAQAPPDTLNAQQRREAPYRTLNPTRITTGVLLDRTVSFSPLHRLDGSRDTAISYGRWQQLYLEFWNASLRRELLATPTEVEQRLNAAPGLPGLPLRVLHYRYDRLRPDAEALGRIRTDTATGQVYDVAGAESPYTQERVLAVACPLRRVYSDVVPFFISREQFFGNQAPDGATLRLDFGDGQGWREVALGQVVTVTYPTRGDKVVRLRWTQHGQQLQASTGLRVAFVPPPDRAISLTTTTAWPGERERGRLRAYVAAGVGNPKVLDASGRLVQKICKPLVFVEGIDFGRSGNDPSDSVAVRFNIPGGIQLIPFQYGEAGWPLMQDYDSEYKSLEKLPSMRQRLQNLGYDVIYVDFNDGEALIEQNAMALVQLLRWLRDPANRTEPACVDNDIVVMGASMGGQVARFALTWLEQQREPHCTSLYVSFDSPHFGASVPIGLQHMLQDLASLAILSADEAAAINLNKLKSPASQQMLRLHVDGWANGPTAMGQTWQHWQTRPDSWPTSLRKVAVANGSRIGASQGYGGGAMLLETSSAGAAFIGHKRAYAVPGTTAFGHNNVVYRDGNGLTGSNHTVTVSSSTPPWDSAPGCVAEIARTLWEEGETQVGPATIRVFDRSSIRPNCFMPTVSTLGIHAAMLNPSGADFGYDIQGQLTNRNRPDPTKYRFDAYFAPDDNEPHVQITDGTASAHSNPSYLSNNAEWIIRELQESEVKPPPVLAAGGAQATWHYASAYHKLLRTVTVGAGGQLFVNKAGLAVNGGPLATLNQPQPLAGTFVLTTRTCGATVTVAPGGLFELGTPGADATSGYKAEVQFLSGSVLDIAGGTLTVNAHSTLRMRAGSVLVLHGAVNVYGFSSIILERGSRLEIRPGAQIALQDPRSRLALHGEFALAAGATFQPTGTGYVAFDLPAGSGNSNIEIADASCRFILRGTGPDHVMAKLAANTHLQPTLWDGFEMTFENGTVEMGEESFINCATATVRIVGATFLGQSGAGGAGRYKTVLIHGCGRETVHDSRFIGGKYGLQANLNYCNGTPIGFENLAFEKCWVGAQVAGKGATFVNCTFDGQREMMYHQTQNRDYLGYVSLSGVEMDGMSFPDNVIRGCTVTNYPEGISFKGSIGTNLLLDGPQIQRNKVGVRFESEEGRLRGECGAIFRNELHGIVVQGGVLNLSKFSVLRNGSDDLSNPRQVRHYANIQLIDATGLELENGHNNLTGINPNETDIDGSMRLSGPPVIVNGLSQHAATSNRWNVRDAAPATRLRDIFVKVTNQPATPLLELVDRQPAAYTLCGVDPCLIPLPNGAPSLPCWIQQRVAYCPTCEPVSTSFTAPDSLHRVVALIFAGEHRYNPATGDDATAMRQLAEVLLLPLTDTTAHEKRILTEAYRELLALYAGLATDSARATWSQHQLFNQVMDGKIDDAEPAQPLHNPEFYLRMNKALAAYSADDVDAALAQLAEAAPLTTPLTQENFDYWECYLTLTQQFKNGTLPEMEYLDQIITCREARTAGRGTQRQTADEYIAEILAAQAARDAAAHAKAADQARVQLIPNPATGTVTVALTEAPGGETSLTLRTLTGQLVRRWTRHATAGANAWPLELGGVAPGVYTLTVGTAARTETRRLLVQ